VLFLLCAVLLYRDINCGSLETALKGTGRVGILMKEELCEKVIKVWRKSDRVMALVVIPFGEKVIIYK